MTRFDITEIESNLAQNSDVGSLKSLTDSSKSVNFSIEVRLMFFSLDRPMTRIYRWSIILADTNFFQQSVSVSVSAADFRDRNIRPSAKHFFYQTFDEL